MSGAVGPLLYCLPRPAAGWGPFKEDALRSSQLAHRMVDMLVDRQAEDVVLLDLTSLSAFTDYFVVATVDNPRHMRAVIDVIDEAANELSVHDGREEGTPESGWVLFDLPGVVVHLFTLERRAYYNLEGLWDSAREVVRIQ